MKCHNFERRESRKLRENEQIVADSVAFWERIAVAVAGSGNCKDKMTPAKWAEHIASEYVELRVKLRDRIKEEMSK